MFRPENKELVRRIVEINREVIAAVAQSGLFGTHTPRILGVDFRQNHWGPNQIFQKSLMTLLLLNTMHTLQILFIHPIICRITVLKVLEDD